MDRILIFCYIFGVLFFFLFMRRRRRGEELCGLFNVLVAYTYSEIRLDRCPLEKLLAGIGRVAKDGKFFFKMGNIYY